MIGTTLSHYKIEDRIGQGGMGVVYRATDTRLGRAVAIKVIAADAAGDRDRRDRFLREARSASALNHPNIVTIHEVDHANGIDFLVMELVGGHPLNEMIPRAGLPLERAIELAEQIANALAIAHASGIVHRDVKPSNIVISDSGQAKMLDFGLAKVLAPPDPAARHGDGCARDGVWSRRRHDRLYVAGTGAGAADHRSLGHLLVRRRAVRNARRSSAVRRDTVASILTETPPPIGSARKDMLPALEALIAACLDKTPARRPGARDVADRLRAIRGRLTAGRLDVRALLQRRAFVAGLAAVVVTALSLGWWWWAANARVRWARTVAIPQIRLLSETDDMYGVYMLATQARTVLPDDAQLTGLWNDVAFPATVTTDPPGAEIAIRPYAAHDAAWYPVGQSPLKDVRVPAAMLRFRIVKAGYEPLEAGVIPVGPPIAFALSPLNTAPAGMLRAPGRPASSTRSHGDPRRLLDRPVRGHQPAIQDVRGRRRVSYAVGTGPNRSCRARGRCRGTKPWRSFAIPPASRAPRRGSSVRIRKARRTTRSAA